MFCILQNKKRLVDIRLNTHANSPVFNNVFFIDIVEAQGRLTIATGNECIVSKASEYRRLADAVFAAQYNLLLRYFDRRHVVVIDVTRTSLSVVSTVYRYSFISLIYLIVIQAVAIAGRCFLIG